MAKKKKQSKAKNVVKVIQPSVPSTIPDFTDRAVSTSNSKRIRFLKAIESLISKVKAKEQKFTISKLIEAEYIANSLTGKVSKKLGLRDMGILLKASKVELVEKKNGGQTQGVTEISLVKG